MKTTKIEWTDATWNPSVGCNKVSKGCRFCYAEVMAKRLKAMGVKEYENGFKFSIHPDRLQIPIKNKKPTKYFVNSMSDLFHEKMPYDYLDDIFDVIKKTPHHIYQILTKRDKIMVDYLSNKQIPSNVWMGVTVDVRSSKKRIDNLRKIDSAIRFISFEPLLEDLGELDLSAIHWAIVGGESGVQARPMKAEWALSIQKQCKEQNVAFFFKQWGTWGADGVKRSKKANGRLLENRIWEESPAIAV